MSQPSAGDYDVDAQPSGSGLRTENNDIIAAILSQNSGTTEPPIVFDFMQWANTNPATDELNIRNPGNTAFIKWAEIDATTIKLFSEGAAVVGLANTDPFTEPQIIFKTGALASMTVRSDRTTGIAASLDLGGQNAAAEDIIGVRLDATVDDNTDASEDFSARLKVVRAGSEVTRMTFDDGVQVVGTLEADVLNQNGTDLDDIVETAKGAVTTDGFSGTTATVTTDFTRGERNKFTGASASTVTVDSGTAGDVYPLMNDGTADITFSAGGGVTIVGGTTLGQEKVCTIEYVTATRVFIYGQNA